EEQFYVIFPILLVLGWRFGRRRLFYCVLLIALGSFVYSTLLEAGYTGLRSAREASFYLLPPRAWQLMLGALVAFLPAREYGPARAGFAWRNVLSVGALFLILVPI